MLELTYICMQFVCLLKGSGMDKGRTFLFESLNNVKKRREIRRKITLNLLNKENIISKMQTEQRLCLILDNYSVHKSAFIKKIALHLNITLIYLPPYSPHLNPIEQIWRQMKREIKHYYLKSKEYLEDLTIKTYTKSILDTKVYDKWFETYIPKSLVINYKKNI